MTAIELADAPQLAQTVAPEALPATTATGTLAATAPAGLMLSMLREHGNLDQFERMIDMQERREAEKAFNDAMIVFRALNIKIPKRKQADFENSRGGRTQYKHPELNDVTDLQPAMDSGDHLHPGDAGYRAMAAAVDVDGLLGAAARR